MMTFITLNFVKGILDIKLYRPRGRIVRKECAEEELPLISNYEHLEAYPEKASKTDSERGNNVNVLLCIRYSRKCLSLGSKYSSKRVSIFSIITKH